MARIKKKTLAEFETVHGQGKVKELQKSLEQERAKVESLADVSKRITVETSKECRLKFGITGDRHHGSLYHAHDFLAAFYEYAESQGVKNIYDTGDILDGHKVYRGQEFELRDIGIEAQIERVVKSSPKSNIITHFITGNHDGSFKSLAGVPVGKMIQQSVKNYKFLGEEQATIVFTTPAGDFSLMLLHPGGGSSYAISYRPQKIIESLEGGKKPNMLAIGHYHKAEFLPSYRNVALCQSGTFQKQTPFMARQGLAAHVGGWIFDITVGGSSNVIRGEFVAFY